jgi:hypothetical protein
MINDPLPVVDICHIRSIGDRFYTVCFFIFLRERWLQREESEAFPIKPGRNKKCNVGYGCTVSKTPRIGGIIR